VERESVNDLKRAGMMFLVVISVVVFSLSALVGNTVDNSNGITGAVIGGGSTGTGVLALLSLIILSLAVYSLTRLNR